MKQHYRMFAAYNSWANRELYRAAAEGLSDEALRRDTGAFFGSLLGTLNHILVADRIWLWRFTGEGEAPARLDAILHDDLPSLTAARQDEDERIRRFVDGLSEEALAGTFTYTTVSDKRTVTQRLAPALAHLFNHQTHHRGQAHGILSVLDVAPPSLDLIRFQRLDEGREFA